LKHVEKISLENVKLFENFSEIAMDMRDVKKMLDAHLCGFAFFKLFDLDEKTK